MSEIYHISGNAKIAFDWIIKTNDSKNIVDSLIKNNKFLEDIKEAVREYGINDVELYCKKDEWCHNGNVDIDLTEGE